jgi:transcriptional regulator with XRE-family HTH domain
MTLREWRQKQGLTQEALAGKLETDRALVTKWELGTHAPTMRSALKILELTGGEVTLEDLVKTSEKS